MNAIEQGICQCIREPRASDGLEGYRREYVYKFEKLSAQTPVYKIYFQNGCHYNLCEDISFQQFFEIKVRLESAELWKKQS